MAAEHGHPKYVYPARCCGFGHLVTVHPHDLLWKEMEKSDCSEVLPFGGESVLMDRR